ncbi:MAG: type II toxin-antitoxin system ParD family antitoxin [Rhodospirillales bacterium]|nr:type II toxin-antitoxin system ParD family antitoxin [Rhodospirillales bacterium]
MPSTHSKNVALTPELSAFVDDLVSSGDYANASEVMRAGLRALKDRHSLDDISHRITTALDQLDRGEGVTGDPAKVLGGVLEAARNRHTQ